MICPFNDERLTALTGRAGDEVLANVEKDTAPTLLLQAEEERVVDNLMHDRYCELRAAAGHPCEGGKPLLLRL